MRFQLFSVVVLILSVAVKLWMSYFNKKLGKRINSKVMMAVSARCDRRCYYDIGNDIFSCIFKADRV